MLGVRPVSRQLKAGRDPCRQNNRSPENKSGLWVFEIKVHIVEKLGGRLSEESVRKRYEG